MLNQVPLIPLRDKLVAQLAEHFEIPKSHIMGHGDPARDEANKARRAAMYLHHYHARCTWAETARVFGRTPGTVTIAIQRFEKDLKDDSYRKFIEKLMK